MKFVAILSLLTTLSQPLTIRGDGAPGDLATMVYGGMGSSCKDPAYVNLVAKLKEGLKSHVECFETKVLNSIKS
jgi:hypothetical protein